MKTVDRPTKPCDPCTSAARFMMIIALFAFPGCGSETQTDPQQATKSTDGQVVAAADNANSTAQTPGQASSTKLQKPLTADQIPDVPPPKPKTVPASEPQQKPEVPEGAWSASIKLPIEYWETQYLNSARIGVTHYKIEWTDPERQAAQPQGSHRITTTATTTLTIQRGKDKVRQTVKVQTIEKNDGTLQSFFEDVFEGDTVTKTEGSVGGNLLMLKKVKGTEVTPINVPWSETAWGPMGVQQVLMRKPMKPGERRYLQELLPQVYQLATVSMVAGNEEETPMLDGSQRKLLPVDVTMQMGNTGILTRIWVDEAGQVFKSVLMMGLNISSYRVSREEAERMDSEEQVDLMAATSIPIDTPAEKLRQAESVVYTITSKSKDPYTILSKQVSQAVVSKTAFRCELTVYRNAADSTLPPNLQPQQPKPSDASLASSWLIQSSDPLIAQLATRLGEGEKDPEKLAIKLTEGVHKTIRKKNFSRAFDSARDVATRMEGDCTEHAVLLTALLRQQMIPARVASGVIAVERDNETAMIYHMWTEAWVGERWLALDAAFGGRAGCDHIKFLESDLDSNNPYLALLPVMGSLGDLKIQVLSTK